MSSMARLSYGYKKKLDKDAVLNKKVPENPRYRCVRPVVDSGFSVRRYVGRMQEIYKNVKYKRGEIFKRIKLSTFVTLVIEVAKELQQQTREDNGECSDVTLARGETNYRNSTGVQQYSSAQSEVSELDTTRSTFQSVISGIGELDLRKGVKNSPECNPVSLDEASLPYVLLDVRDRDAYKECHIIIAKNYPYTMLSRSCNYETKELLDFKNRPCKIIVIYDEDETIAPNVASTLVQRGYDNVFLLSGGLKLAALKFPQGLITGTLPKSCISQKSSPVKKRVTLSARSSVSNSEPSTLKLNSLHQLGHSTKNHLTSADIDLLQVYLDRFLISATPSTCPSVYSQSRAITPSTVMNVDKQSGVVNAHRVPGRPKPWK